MATILVYQIAVRELPKETFSMIGKTVGHCKISQELGESRMGVVYRARDKRLDRFAALKTLPAEKVADPDKRGVSSRLQNRLRSQPRGRAITSLLFSQLRGRFL